ncbi:MAG: hypothetical protein WCT33_00565 [Patescibacteria group bacterium]|jgi:Tfp pilus assembly protein PilN
MADINLLRDKDTMQERSRKKAGSAGIELTRPKKEKDDTGKQIKRGGLSEFFGKIFKRTKKERILSQKVVKKDEKLIMVSHDKVKEPKNGKVEDIFEVEKPRESVPAKKLVNSDLRPTIIEKRESKISDLGVNQMQSKFVKQDNSEEKKPRKKFFTWSSPENGLNMKKDVKIVKQSGLKTNTDKNLSKIVPLEEKIQSLDVNLIPDDILGNLEPKAKLKQLGIATGIIAVIVGLAYGYMMYRESKIEGDIQELVMEINGLDQEIAGLGNVKEDAQTLKKQMDSVSQVLDSHIYWSQFLADLEKYTLPNVYYKNLAATTEGKITLSATAIDLATLADQYLVFQNASDFVSDVTIESAVSAITEEEGASSQNAVDFNISLEINPDIFFLKEEQPI